MSTLVTTTEGRQVQLSVWEHTYSKHTGRQQLYGISMLSTHLNATQLSEWAADTSVAAQPNCNRGCNA